MPKQFLDGRQVRTVVEHDGGKCVAQHVRRALGERRDLRKVKTNLPPHLGNGQPHPLGIDKKRARLPTAATGTKKQIVLHLIAQFTAEGKERKNLWFAGFYPAEDPQYTIVVLQDGQTQAAVSSAAVFAQLCTALHWLG